MRSQTSIEFLVLVSIALVLSSFLITHFSKLDNAKAQNDETEYFLLLTLESFGKKFQSNITVEKIPSGFGRIGGYIYYEGPVPYD